MGVLFYLAYPLLYLLACLPFWALYGTSNAFYYILSLSGYRKKVIQENLRNSFPEKSGREIERISRDYYRYLCDLILETLKTLRMTEAESRQRCTFHQSAVLDRLYNEKRSFIIVMGHHGNWEWAGPCFTLNTKYQLVVIYRPLSNPYFERMTASMRTRFGTRITAVNNTLRDMIADRNEGRITATAFIADQTASPENAYWMTFLNQDTAVFTGPEKLAIKFDYPVIYMNVRRPSRGYYEITPELLVENPRSTAPGEITERFTKRLEQDILSDPVIWLWSHRRWKHKRRSE